MKRSIKEICHHVIAGNEYCKLICILSDDIVTEFSMEMCHNDKPLVQYSVYLSEAGNQYINDDGIVVLGKLFNELVEDNFDQNRLLICSNREIILQFCKDTLSKVLSTYDAWLLKQSSKPMVNLSLYETEIHSRLNTYIFHRTEHEEKVLELLTNALSLIINIVKERSTLKLFIGYCTPNELNSFKDKWILLENITLKQQYCILEYSEFMLINTQEDANNVILKLLNPSNEIFIKFIEDAIKGSGV
jgi:hypothetical protein